MYVVMVTYVFSFVSLNVCYIEKKKFSLKVVNLTIFISYVMYEFLDKG
jgi:hypothetical protein